MTLKEFLNATSAIPEPVLRCAMTAALSVEPARTPDACRRFYSRVVHELGLATEAARDLIALKSCSPEHSGGTFGGSALS